MPSRGTLIYVAGASDRGPGVADHVARITAQLAAHAMDLDVVAAEWGDVAGATLDHIDLAMPETTAPPPAIDLVQGPLIAAAGATIFARYIGIDPGPDALRWATDVVMPHRAEVMRLTLLGIADVLLFQRNPEPIRRIVTDAVAGARAGKGPLIVLGNSLGSVILVDAMMMPGAPRPDLVVTVGSQAPLLQTIGALAEPGSPPPFQPWLNIYDRRDPLGFVAARVWPDQVGISDVEIDMGVGFPDSHGATYLSHPQVYEAIRSHPAFSSPTPDDDPPDPAATDPGAADPDGADQPGEVPRDPDSELFLA